MIAYSLVVIWANKRGCVALCRENYKPMEPDIEEARRSFQWRNGFWPEGEPDSIAVYWRKEG